MVVPKSNSETKGNLEELVNTYKQKYKKRANWSKIIETLHVSTSLLAGYGYKAIVDYGLELKGATESGYLDALCIAGITYFLTQNMGNKFLYKKEKKLFNSKKDLISNDQFLNPKKSIDRICNWIYKHPLIIGTCAFASTSLSPLFSIMSKNFDYLTNQATSEHLLFYNTFALAAYGGSLFAVNLMVKAFKLLHKVHKTENLMHYVKMTIPFITNNKKKLTEEYLKTVPKNKSYNFQNDVASFLMQEGNFEEALTLMAEEPKSINDNQFLLSNDDIYLFNPKSTLISNIKNSEKKLTKRFNDFLTHFVISQSYLFLQDYQKVQDHVTLACNVDPNHKTEANVLGSLIYDHVPIKGLAKKQWKKTIDLVLDDKKLQYSRLGESNAEVYQLNPKNHKFLSNFFVFKANSNKAVLEQEEYKTMELEELVKDSEEFGTAQSLHLSEEIDGQYFYVSKYNDGTTLSESKDIEDYKKAAKYLGLIHKGMKSDKGLSRWMDKEIHKYLSHGISSDLRQDISLNLKVAYNGLKGDLVFDKDAHIFNWIKAEDGKMIAIDNEDRGYINQFLDLVKIAEYSDICENDFNKRKEIVKEYFDSYGQTQLSDKEIELSYLNATIIRAFAFYSFVKDKEIESQKSYNRDTKINAIINGVGAIEQIQEKYSNNYSNDELNKYGNLQSILKNLM